MNKLGLDMGTKNFVLASRIKEKIVFKREINGFIVINNDSLVKRMLLDQGVSFVERGDEIVALGSKAEDLAYAFPDVSLQRPMASGVVNKKERMATQIMAVLVKSLIGKLNDDTVVYYCVPGGTINEETNIDYHAEIMQLLFDSLSGDVKIDAFPINEARALVVSSIEDKTGIGISCLTPGNKVYCNNGLENIEDIKIGDFVLSGNGQWNKVIKTTVTKRNEEVIKFDIDNSSFDPEFTRDHEIFVYRQNGWQKIFAEEARIGDIVGEPIINRHQKRNFISFKDRIGNGKQTNSVFELSYNASKFIGYFLGDGHINIDKGYIRFDFGPDEYQYYEDVDMIMNKVFHRNTYQVAKNSRNNIRQSTHYKALAGWLFRKCYRNELKCLPWPVDTLSIPAIIGLIQGMIRSDGCMNTNNDTRAISFENKSHYLATQLHQMLGMVHINSSISHRNSRESEIDGRRIVGCEEGSYTVTITGHDYGKLLDLLNHEPSSERQFMIGGIRSGKIRNITIREYNGDVYDITVENNHTFAMPGMYVHNCGAGMINVSYCMFGMPIYEFSLVGAGDWITKATSDATGEDNLEYVNKIKEQTKLGTEPPVDFLEKAVWINTRVLIRKITTGIIDGFNQNEKQARAGKSMPVVLAGGTASPEGFRELFSSVFAAGKMPFEIGEITIADKPLYAVAKGCLIAAEMHEVK